MIKRIAIGIVAVLVVGIAVVLGVAAMKPDSFRVQRSASIKAPPEKIYPLVADLRGHVAWSPWEKKDPAMRHDYSGPAAGVGASMAWDGNNEIGKGRMEIVEAVPPRRLAMKLDFIKPFEGHNMAEFTFEPNGATTTVTWAIFGPSPFVSKVMDTLIGMDRMIGKEFEAGLADLKTLAEK